MAEIMYVETNGVNEIAERKSLGWLVRQTGERVIWAYQNSNIEQYLGRMFRSSDVKKFLREKRIADNFGVINLHTTRNPMPVHIQASVILLYPQINTLEQLQNYPNLSRILIMPWTMEECRSWLVQNGARQVI